MSKNKVFLSMIIGFLSILTFSVKAEPYFSKEEIGQLRHYAPHVFQNKLNGELTLYKNGQEISVKEAVENIKQGLMSMNKSANLSVIMVILVQNLSENVVSFSRKRNEVSYIIDYFNRFNRTTNGFLKVFSKDWLSLAEESQITEEGENIIKCWNIQDYNMKFRFNNLFKNIEKFYYLLNEAKNNFNDEYQSSICATNLSELINPSSPVYIPKDTNKDIEEDIIEVSKSFEHYWDQKSKLNLHK